MISAEEALDHLREGNRRFTAGLSNEAALPGHYRRQLIAGEQEPIAIILGCSDSRVPAEIVFDQGLGDLFVIRVAGNIVAPSQIGSVEFAASKFGTPLVVVLGHSQCGAVLATLEYLQNRPAQQHSENSYSIIGRIAPAVNSLLDSPNAQDRDALCQSAVHANVMASVKHLQSGSTILERLIASKALLIVGAEYSLVTGAVDFL